MYQMIAMAAMQFMSAKTAEGAAINARYDQMLAQTEENTARLEDNTADNKAISEMNLQNQIRTGYRVGVLNVQRGQAAKAAAQSGINLGKSKLQALGAANANAAAAGSIGSSVDAVVLDIEMQAEQADASLVEDQRVQESNFDSSMRDILMAGQDALQSAKHINLRGVTRTRRTGDGELLAGALINTAGQYAGQYMTLGLGNK